MVDGYFSAKFDNILNLLPARLTAAASGILSFVVGGKIKETFSGYYLIFIILIYLVLC